MICEKIGIDMDRHTVNLKWNHLVLTGTDITCITTQVDNNVMDYMFDDAVECNGIPRWLLQIEPTIHQDVGTFTRDGHHNFGHIGGMGIIVLMLEHLGLMNIIVFNSTHLRGIDRGNCIWKLL